MISEEAIALCPEGRDGFSRRQFLRGVVLFGGMTLLSANGVRYTFAASTNWTFYRLCKKERNYRSCY